LTARFRDRPALLTTIERHIENVLGRFFTLRFCAALSVVSHVNFPCRKFPLLLASIVDGFIT
jgi:hypothetical protein